MLKHVLLSLAVAASLLVILESAALSQDNSERRIRKSQATEKSKQRRAKAAPPAARPQGSGWPSCRGLLWIDSLCQLDDGRVCYVDENILVSCQ
jgi:hypothetical protein